MDSHPPSRRHSPTDKFHNQPFNTTRLHPPYNPQTVFSHTPSSNESPWHCLWYLLKTTGTWTAAGLICMLLGITISHVFILRQVYVCPQGATCPRAFDPKDDVIQNLRTVMQYVLQLGTMIAGVGLGKLVAYQSQLLMKRQGKTIAVLDLNLGALKGNPLDAGLLALKRGNRWSSLFILLSIGITLAIGFVVGLSVSNVGPTGRVLLPFRYPENITIFSRDQSNVHAALSMMNGWMDRASASNLPLADDFQGTLVVRDDRTRYGINLRPSGPRITGDIFCFDPTANLSVVLEPGVGGGGVPFYNITYDTEPDAHYLVAYPDVSLAVSSLMHGDCVRTVSGCVYHVLWASNTAGLIPNATATPDGMIHIAICNHTIQMVSGTRSSPQVEGTGMQYIEPSDVVPDYPGRCPDADFCVLYAVHAVLRSWWDMELGETFISCKNGVLGPLHSYSDGGAYGPFCLLDGQIWAATLAAVLDAIIQTGSRSGERTQELWVRAESISTGRWWLQGIIPLLTFLLYVGCVGYTFHLGRNRGSKEDLRELNLFEVVAAGTDELHELVRLGSLESSTVVGGWRSPVTRIGR